VIERRMYSRIRETFLEHTRVVVVAQHLQGTMEGGFGLLRAAACAPAPRLRARSRAVARGGRGPVILALGLVPALPVMAGPVADADDLTAGTADRAEATGTATARGRDRAARPSSRRRAGARRPAAKGGRGRGRGGRGHHSISLTPRCGRVPATSFVLRRRRAMGPAAARFVSTPSRAVWPGQTSR